MATLTAWRFDTTDGAERAVTILLRMAQEGDIGILDAAVVSWPPDQKKPRTRRLNDVTAGKTGWGAFWGFLFGLLFFIPVFGMAIGAGMGALMGKFAKTSIDKQFQDQVRGMLKPGTSALFLMVEKVTPDKAVEAMSKYGGTVLKTSLSKEGERELQEALRGGAQ